MRKRYKIPRTFDRKYKGLGLSLCSVLNNEVTNIFYIKDIIFEFSTNFDRDCSKNPIEEVVNDDRIIPYIRFLQLTGDVYIGVCGCWEFHSR